MPDFLAWRRGLEAGVKPAFLPASSFRLRLWPASFLTPSDFRYRGSALRRSGSTSFSQGLVAEIGGATWWLWLSSDALRPWQHRSWIFPRDPSLGHKAGPILDLYQRVWEGAYRAPMTMPSPQTKRPAFRLVAGSSQLCLPLRTAPPGLKASIFARTPGSTWLLE